MHFRVTEFKQALRNEDFDSLVFIDGDGGSCRMELTVRLSSVYREKMIWHKLTGTAAAEGAGNVLDAGAFRALREVLEPLCLYASSHVAFKRTLVAALNHLIFDDGRLVLAEPTVEGPFMDPSLTEAHFVPPQPLSGRSAGSGAPSHARSHAAAAAAGGGHSDSASETRTRTPNERAVVPVLQARSYQADDKGSWREAAPRARTSGQQRMRRHEASSGQHAPASSAAPARSMSYASLLKRMSPSAK